jgi:hypothetical protein
MSDEKETLKAEDRALERLANFKAEKIETGLRKVYGGDPDTSVTSLCMTCRNGMRTVGTSSVDVKVHCRMFDKPIQMAFVSECSSYDDKRLPSLYDMRQIAWVLETDRKAQKTIGFRPPKVSEWGGPE